MRRGGGGRGGRGGGGGGGGGYGRRDTRSGGGASRDDRDRRLDHRPRRTPSPERHPRRPRGEDEDDYRVPPRGSRIGYGSPSRRERTSYGDRRASPRRGRVEHGDPRDPPHRAYGVDRHLSPRGPREYGGDRHISPRGAKDYARALLREERDPDGRGGGQRYETPPPYMLPDHPSDLGRPSLRAGKNESNYLGGSGDRSLFKGDYLGSSLGNQSIDKESELFGSGGATLRIRATETGRTTAMYSQDRRSPQPRRSPPPRAVLSPPLYPTVPPETGFLIGGSAMKASEDYGAGNIQQHVDDSFKYHKHSRDPYIDRSRDIERHYSGSRDLVVENGGTERFYSAGDVTEGRVRQTDRLYSSSTLEPDLVPCTQSKFLGDSSPALLAKDHPYRMQTEPVYEPSNEYIMDGLGRSSHDSLGHGSGHRHKLSGSPLEHGSAYGDETLLDIARQSHHKRALRAASMEYDPHDEHARRDPINDAYAAPENLLVNASRNSRYISAAPSLRGNRDERINHNLRLPHRTEEFESGFEATHRDMKHLNKHSYDGDATIQYPTTRGGNDCYSRSPESEPIGIARRPVRHHESALFENLSDQEASPLVSRKRYRSPTYLYHEYHADHRFAVREHYDDDMDAYVLSPPRVSGYDMVDGDEYDERYDTPANCNVFSRLALPHENNGELMDMDQGNHPHSDILTYGHQKHIPLSQRLSRPNSHSQFRGTFMHGRGRGRGGLTKSAKKRLKTGSHQFHGGYVSEKNEFIKPNKFYKLSEDDPNGSEVKHEDAPENEDLPVQKDPPEGSEEFSKQVHQAFLNYVKILNESSATQKKYREAAKGSLSCCVCGRFVFLCLH